MKSGSKSGYGDRRSYAVDYASKAARDNRSRQLNPQHDAYWRSRAYGGRPGSSRHGSSKKSR